MALELTSTGAIGSALIGAAVGATIFALMAWRGLLQDAGPSAVMLAAIAAFWPVFAAADEDWSAFILHGLAAFAFIAIAVFAGTVLKIPLALAIAGHGGFDLAQAFVIAPVGPVWWPAFCGGLDIVLGSALVWYWRPRSEELVND